MPSYRRWLVVCGDATLQPFSLFLDQSGPVRLGLREIAFGILVEVVPHAFGVLKQQPAIDDLEGVHVNFHQLAFRDAVGAVAAEYGFISSFPLLVGGEWETLQQWQAAKSHRPGTGGASQPPVAFCFVA